VLRKALTNTGTLRRGNTSDGQSASSTDSAIGTTGESSSSVDATTGPALSPVEDAVGSAVSVAAPFALCGADQAAVEGAGSGLPVSVIAAGDVAVAVESPLAPASATTPGTAAVLSLLGSASVAVVVEADAAQGSDVVVVADAAAVVSAPSVVLPVGATASPAADVHDVPVAAVVVPVASPVVSAVVVVLVGEDDVSVGEGDASVGEADVSVDELEVAVSDAAAVTSEGVTDTPTVVSAVCASPVASAVAIVVSPAAEAAVVSVACAVVSTVWAGGVGTSSALAGAIQAGAETTATIRTAVQPIRRRSRRRGYGPSNGASLRLSSVISSLPRTDRFTPRVEYHSYLKENKAPGHSQPSGICRLTRSLGLDQPQVEVEAPRLCSARARCCDHERWKCIGVDAWLWAYVLKTRALAAETVVGRVHVNGEGVQPAMLVHANDVHEITRDTKRRTVRVLEVAEPPVA
jgi:ribosomal 50S subunit-recycling heat shock protein